MKPWDQVIVDRTNRSALGAPKRKLDDAAHSGRRTTCKASSESGALRYSVGPLLRGAAPMPSAAENG